MSIFDSPINETEQAAEKGVNHFFDRLTTYTDYVFSKLWRTRIVLDIGQREMPGDKHEPPQ